MSVGRIPLPKGTASLEAYINQHQAQLLAEIYTNKAHRYARQADELDRARRGRKGRRRRAKSAEIAEAEDISSDDTDDGTPMPEVAEGEKRQKKRRKISPNDAAYVDPGHLYQLTYTLSTPADTYYHGPHPPPPPRVVASVLKAARRGPVFDPSKLAHAQLLTVATKMWDREPLPPAPPLSDPDPPTIAIQEEDWENGVIASFSSFCDTRILQTIETLPLSKRPTPALLPQVPMLPPVTSTGQYALAGPAALPAVPTQFMQVQPPRGAFW